MELDIFGFQFGKKEPSKQKKEDKLLQSFTVPEMFDGTVFHTIFSADGYALPTD